MPFHSEKLQFTSLASCCSNGKNLLPSFSNSLDYNWLKHILLEHNIQMKLNNRWWVPASIAIRSRPCHVSPNESLLERLRLSLCCNQSMHGHSYLLVVYCLASKDPSNLSTWPASVTPRIALLSDFLLLYLQPQ